MRTGTTSQVLGEEKTMRVTQCPRRRDAHGPRPAVGWEATAGALVFVWLLVLLAFPCGAEPAATEKPDDSGVRFVVEIGSRLYPDWHDSTRVGLFEPFFLSDTDLTARVERFVPDFRISDTGEILSHSDELNNPAVFVVVSGDSAASDSTWAFLNFPPHFSRRSFFTFQLKAIEGYEPPARDRDPAIKEGDDDG